MPDEACYCFGDGEYHHPYCPKYIKKEKTVRDLCTEFEENGIIVLRLDSKNKTESVKKLHDVIKNILGE